MDCMYIGEACICIVMNDDENFNAVGSTVKNL